MSENKNPAEAGHGNLLNMIFLWPSPLLAILAAGVCLALTGFRSHFGGGAHAGDLPPVISLIGVVHKNRLIEATCRVFGRKSTRYFRTILESCYNSCIHYSTLVISEAMALIVPCSLPRKAVNPFTKSYLPYSRWYWGSVCLAIGESTTSTVSMAVTQQTRVPKIVCTSDPILICILSSICLICLDRLISLYNLTLGLSSNSNLTFYGVL